MATPKIKTSSKVRPFALLLARTQMTHEECAAYLAANLDERFSKHIITSWVSRDNYPAPTYDVNMVMCEAVRKIDELAAEMRKELDHNPKNYLKYDMRDPLERAAVAQAIAYSRLFSDDLSVVE